MNTIPSDSGDPTQATDRASVDGRFSAADHSAADERLSVADLRSGMQVDEVYLVLSKDVRATKSGKPFLKLRVGDRSGGVDCMVWENAERLSEGFRQGDLVRVRARASEYAGRVQLEAADVQINTVEVIDPRAFLPATYRDVEELKGFLRYHVESVYDRDLRGLLDSFFGDADFLERFANAPAAKSFHHAYLGGLLEHTVTVTGLADHVCQQYGRINRDLLITAALLHDVGKVEELTYDRSIDYSDAGRFLGHVILGVNLVTVRAAQLPSMPEEKLQLLLHAIVSHHGELEWGSPKRPKTLEALIIHHLDNLDAKVKGFLELVEGSRDADWTDLRNLFRRPLHVPRASHQELDFLPASDDDT